jgi:SNF2 family DNA or RNA helicase
MNFTPRPYQEIAIAYGLEHPRSALFLPMGMGKTAAVLSIFDTLQFAEVSRRMLVIAPLRVAQSVWPAEVKKWDQFKHLKVSVVTGTSAQRVAALRVNADIYCINYDNIEWLTDFYSKGWPFDFVVCDESTRLKGVRAKQGTKRAGALKRIIRAAKRWVNLTGTPAPNGYLDLWGQTFFLDKGFRLGDIYTAYQQRWFYKERDGFSYKLRVGAEKEIQKKLSNICLTLKAEDYFDIGDPIVNNLEVDLPPKARKLYDKFEKEMYTELGEYEIEAFNAAALTNKCSQLANGAAYVDDKGNWEGVHDAKLTALESIVTEAAGMPVLVAYWFKSDLARLKKFFPQGKALDKKPKTLSDWNKGKIPILFAHPQSAGHGLNLQDGGNIITFFSMTWNLEYHDQIIERIGPVRQLQSGYDRPVFIHYILAKDTTDRVMLDRLKSKASVQSALLEALRRRNVRES